jgi:hypothetical protein
VTEDFQREVKKPETFARGNEIEDFERHKHN